MKDSGDKIPAEMKSKFESAIADAKKDLESSDPGRMKSAMEKLTAIGGELYAEAAKATQAAGGSADPGAPGDATAGEAKAEGSAKKTEKKADVVDAEFEVVDDPKKK